MKVYKTKCGYFYKEYKNGRKKRISKEEYLKFKLKKKQANLTKQKGGNTRITLKSDLLSNISFLIFSEFKLPPGSLILIKESFLFFRYFEILFK